MIEKGFRIEIPVNIKRWHTRKVIPQEDLPTVQDVVPRAARLLALAHRWEGMVRRGEVAEYVEIARLAGLTRGRVTQICSLTLLAPDLQEAHQGFPAGQSIVEAARRRPGLERVEVA